MTDSDALLVISVVSFLSIWFAIMGGVVWIEFIEDKINDIDKKLDLFVGHTLELVKRYGDNRKK